MADIQRYKHIAQETIEKEEKALREISLKIHANPELAWEEYEASKLLSTYLEEKGFQVQRNYKDVTTAFKATSGSGKPVIAILSEMDALPGIGHACGHNLIAVSGLAAGIAIKAVLDQVSGSGTVIVMGTPAEEGGGGKAKLIEGGAFEDVDAAIMCHPARNDQAYFSALAVKEYDVVYKGKNAHASLAPWDGVNALDAVIMAFNNISFLRQQIRLTDRIHGIITEGGMKPNIIPDRTAACFFVRSFNKEQLEMLSRKVEACFEAAAIGTGCTYELKVGHEYLDLQTNSVMAELYTSNMNELGIVFESKEAQQRMPGGSTDMGNVSYVVPSIHPKFKVSDTCSIHTPAFAEVAKSDEALAATWKAAKGMAMTALDLIFKPETLEAAKKEWNQLNVQK